VKLFQIEEPDGSPADPDLPGAAIGIDASGAEAVVATAVGGNAVVLADREGFALNLSVPAPSAATEAWQSLFEGARLRAERALARPVTHAVVALVTGGEAELRERLRRAAEAAGLAVLRLVARDALSPGTAPALAAAVLAEDLQPRAVSPRGDPV
jgi:hypothetical protein